MLKGMGATQPKIDAAGSPNWKRAVQLLIAMLAVGVVIYVFTILSERMLAPHVMEPFVRMGYRVGYFLRFPVIVLLSPFLPMDEQHHHPHPALHEFVTSFCAPLFWCLLVTPVILARAASRRMMHRLAPEQEPRLRIPRRAFLAGAALAVSAPGGLGTYSVLIEPQRTRIERYRMAIRDLPAALDGFRIVHISDTHYGPFVSLPYIKGVIE